MSPLELASSRKASEQLPWLAASPILGFLVSYLFSAQLDWSRRRFLLAQVVVSGGFAAAYLGWARLDLERHFRARSGRGLLAAALAGAFVVANVLSQPSSPAPAGSALLWALLWEGTVYGVVDALLLSVVPVLAAWQACSSWPRESRWVAALVASAAVTAAYHFGFPEFRGPQLVGPVLGNAVLTLAYLASGNPWAPILAHVAMHVAAVLHGMETTIQLPPHAPAGF